jgi:hypothetical protein
MSVAMILGGGLLLTGALVFAMVRLLAPPKKTMPSAENNWEQRNDLTTDRDSPDVADSLPPIDVAIGFQVDSGGAQ